MAKFFKAECTPQTSKHSLKKKAPTPTFFVTAATKKAAIADVKDLLIQTQGEDGNFYRVPAMTEITEEEYNAATETIKDFDNAAKGEINYEQDWENDESVLMDADGVRLVSAVVSLVGFDGSEYSDEEIEEAVAIYESEDMNNEDCSLMHDLKNAMFEACFPVRHVMASEHFAQVADKGCEALLASENGIEAIIAAIVELGIEYQLDTVTAAETQPEPEQTKPVKTMAEAKERISQMFPESEEQEEDFEIADGDARVEVAKFNFYPPYSAIVTLINSSDGGYYPSFEIIESLDNGNHKKLEGNRELFTTTGLKQPYTEKAAAVNIGLLLTLGALERAFSKATQEHIITEASSLISSWVKSFDTLAERFDTCTISGSKITAEELANVRFTKQNLNPFAEQDETEQDDDLEFLEPPEFDDLPEFDEDEQGGEFINHTAQAQDETPESEPSFIGGVTCAVCGSDNINDDEECVDCKTGETVNKETGEIEPTKTAQEIDLGAMLDELNAEIDALPVGGSIIRKDLPNSVYQAAKGISKGKLDKLIKDPSVISWERDCPVDKEKLTTASIGNAYHTSVLEPHKFQSDFAVMPPLNLRTNEGKAKKAEFMERVKFEQKAILTDEEARKVFYMAASANAHPTVRKLLQAKGDAELSIWYRASETVVFKIRPDYRVVIDGVHHIMDLKSTDYCDQFERSVEKYGYHIQDAFYSYVYSLVTGVYPVFSFCVTQKTCEFGRYPTRLMILHESDKAEGVARMNHAIGKFIECLESGIWGGFETIKRSYFDTRDDMTAVNDRSSRQKKQQ